MSTKALRLFVTPSYLYRRLRNAALLGGVRTLEQKLVWFFNWSIGWALASLFPYGTHAARTTLRLGFYTGLVGIMCAVGLEVIHVVAPAVGSDFLQYTSSLPTVTGVRETITANPVHTGVAFVVWYLLGVFTYTPSDRKNYRANKEPDNKAAQWMFLSAALIGSIIPTGYFLLSRFTPLSGWLVVAGLFFVTAILSRRYHRKLVPLSYHKSLSGSGRLKPSHQHSYIRNESYLGLLVNGLGVALIAVFFGAEMAFVWHVVWMLYLARRMRWILYEDSMGFKKPTPTIWLWALTTRLPVLYAAIVVLRGGGFQTGFAGYLSFAPLVVAPVYLVLRHASLGGTMHSKTYGDYEQMTEYEKRRHKLDVGFALLAGGRKPPSEAELFAGRMRTFNRTLDGVHTAMVDAWGAQKSPRVQSFPTDPEEFDPNAVHSLFDDIEAFLDSHPSDEAWVRLQNARQDFEHAMKAYNYHEMGADN